jgi:hypothetical protein
MQIKISARLKKNTGMEKVNTFLPHLLWAFCKKKNAGCI